MAKTPSEVLERWKTALEEMRADEAWMERHQELDHRRLKALVEMRELLANYLQGEINTAQFDESFQSKARAKREAFDLQGMNGAMFLNKLVGYSPDANRLSQKLKFTLKAPQSPDEARAAMRGLAAYLEELIERGAVRRAELQPARHAVFLSAWWHIQSPESWPIFFPTTVETLEREELFSLKDRLADSYIDFRQTYQALRAALGLNTWQLEHLCAWLNPAERSRSRRQGLQATSAGQVITQPIEPEENTAATQPDHTRAQWALAKIGRKFNCKIWIAPPGRAQIWNNEPLETLSLAELPMLDLDEQTQQIIRKIDVVWLSGGQQPVAAFEIETSASIYSGLLHLADLATLTPDLTFPLYMIASETRLEQIHRELSRPTFQAIDLHRRCGFFSIEELMREMENILRWAKDPSAMDNLARRV
jgi:hypothetical protein